MACVILKKDPPIARVVFNRPVVVNPTDARFVKVLHAVGKALSKAKDIRAVIVTGARRGFCSHIGLRAVAQDEIELLWFREWEATLRLFEAMYDKALICGIHGARIGGGLQFRLTCDMRIAADKLSGIVLFPVSAPSASRAQLLVLAASQIRAKQALAWGLVDQVVTPTTLDTALTDAANMFIHTASAAFRESKKLLLQCYDLPYPDFWSAYLKGQQVCLASSDHALAGDAYLTKTAADFSLPQKKPPHAVRPKRKKDKRASLG